MLKYLFASLPVIESLLIKKYVFFQGIFQWGILEDVLIYWAVHSLQATPPIKGNPPLNNQFLQPIINI